MLLDQVIVRQVTAEDLAGLEWEGEYKHFRHVYAEAFQRMQRGYSMLWVADLPGTGLIGQVFIQFICDRPELADGVKRAYLYSFRVRGEYRSKGWARASWMWSRMIYGRAAFNMLPSTWRATTRAPSSLYVRRGYQVVAPEPGSGLISMIKASGGR